MDRFTSIKLLLFLLLLSSISITSVLSDEFQSLHSTFLNNNNDQNDQNNNQFNNNNNQNIKDNNYNPKGSNNDNTDSNRVLEQFIWQQIITAPTDPQKAFDELRSSLDLITKQSNDNNQNNNEPLVIPPESPLYLLGQSIIQPSRLFNRRSSYGQSPLFSADASSSSSASPTNDSIVMELQKLSSPTAPPLATNKNDNNNNSPDQLTASKRIIKHQYQLPLNANKYIPEMNPKELYQMIAPIAGDPNKEQPPLPPPPPPSPQITSDNSDNNNNLNNNNNNNLKQIDTNDHQSQQLKSITGDNHRMINRIIQPFPSLHNDILRKNVKPITKNQMIQKSTSLPSMLSDNGSILSMQKYTRKALKQLQLTDQKQNKNQQPNNNLKKYPFLTDIAAIIKKKNHQGHHPYSQSQTLYDILPMPSYGQLQQTIRPFSGGSFSSFGGDNFGSNKLRSSSSSNYIPASPANQFYQSGHSIGQSPSFQTKQTYEMIDHHSKSDGYSNGYDHHNDVQQTFMGSEEPKILEPQIIDVVPDEQPIEIVFRSSSAKVNIKQVHTPIPYDEVETTRTEEKPQRVLHQLVRPIVQEVVEIIQPYRHVTQEVRPVIEEIRTVVAKASDNPQQRIQQERLGRGRGKKWRKSK